MEKKIKDTERIKEAEKLSNTVTNKMVIVFCALLAVTVFLINLSQNSAFELAFLTNALLYTQIACGVLFAAALVYRFVRMRKGSDERYTAFSSPLLLGISAALFAVVLLYAHLGSFRAIVGLFAAALLFFVYEIYPLDFYLFTIVSVVGAVAASFVNSSAFRGYEILVNTLAVAVTALVSVVCVVFIAALKEKRTILFLGRKVNMPTDAKILPVIIAAAVAILCVLGVLFFGQILYFIAAICAIYLIVAIIYTVKLM